jgi:hypothetical protein
MLLDWLLLALALISAGFLLGFGKFFGAVAASHIAAKMAYRLKFGSHS